MDTNLKFIFETTNNWLKFAEGKNAALIAINSAITIASLKLLKGEDLTYFSIYYIPLLVCIFISTIISLLSFLPITSIESRLLKQKMNNKPHYKTSNLFFFEHLKHKTPSDLFSEINQSAGNTISSPTALQLNLTEQIIINSKITSRKMALFRNALIISLFGITFPVIGLLFYTIFYTTPKETS